MTGRILLEELRRALWWRRESRLGWLWFGRETAATVRRVVGSLPSRREDERLRRRRKTMWAGANAEFLRRLHELNNS